MSVLIMLITFIPSAMADMAYFVQMGVHFMCLVIEDGLDGI